MKRKLGSTLIAVVAMLVGNSGFAEQGTDTEYDCVIVGAGVSGLTAAYYLKDYHIRILEKENRVGGRTVSGSHEGFTYAKGAEYLGLPEDVFEEMIHELRVSPKEIPSPMDAVYYNEKFYYGEEGIARLLIEHSSLGDYNNFVSTVLEMYEDYENLPDFDPASDIAGLDDLTARKWFAEERFPAIIVEKYNVMAKGLFGANLDEISALSVLEEIAFDFEGAEPVKNFDDLEMSDEKGAEKTDAYTFVTGITEFTNAVGRSLDDRVQLNSLVTAVERIDADAFRITYQDRMGRENALQSKIVILAVPAPVVLQIAKSVINTEQRTILQQVEYASYVTVALFSDVPIWNKAFDLAVPDNLFFTDIYDATWVQRHYDTALRNKHKYITSIYVAPQSYKDKSILTMSDTLLLQNIYRDLDRILPDAESKVTGYDIHRFPFAYPIMIPGAYKRLSRLHEITEESLLLAGDYMIYPTFQTALDAGYLAAEKAIKELESE